MFYGFRNWLRERREWRQMHDAAWSAVILPGPDGISPYMQSIRSDLLAAVPALEFELSGKDEKFFQGVIPGTNAVVYLYGDGAQIHDGPNELFWAEYHDYKTPQELTDRLVARVIEVQPNNSFKPKPLRGSA
jgi:hypothetical protein